MRHWKAEVAVAVVIIVVVLSGCDQLTEVFDPPDEDPTPTPTSYKDTPTPRNTRTPTRKPEGPGEYTPKSKRTPTPTPTKGDEGNYYTTREGDYLEFSLGERTSGTFYFEARGFSEDKFPGDESWMKPVFFWIYNDHSGFDYNGSGFLFQVLQLMHAGYWCTGGKLHLRNHREWLGEICYMFQFREDIWYSFEITWASQHIHLYIDGKKVASAYTNSIVGPITAGIGWPPARRHGWPGLQYRNYGFR